jgi:putative flippase GtrA
MRQKLFIRYLAVGALAYLIEMGSLYGLNHVLGLSPVYSVAISFWVGFIAAFLLQKLVTFKNYEKRAHKVARQIVVYSLLTAWNYGFTLLAVKLLSGVTSVFIIRTGVILVVALWNFAIYKRLFGTADLAEIYD